MFKIKNISTEAAAGHSFLAESLDPGEEVTVEVLTPEMEQARDEGKLHVEEVV